MCSTDHLDFIDICRDDKCLREELHASHDPVGRRGRSRHLFHISRRQLVLDAVYAVIDLRVVKSFSHVFAAVVDDYGSLRERTVYRALYELQVQRKVAVVVPPGSADTLRQRTVQIPGRSSHGFVKGCYVRYDSPLLWEPGGIDALFDQVDDLQRDLGGTLFRSSGSSGSSGVPILDAQLN
jgi:hypothetical protein